MALVDVIQDPFGQIELLRELVPARIHEPVLIDADDASRMVQPYSWLLDLVGSAGSKLTSAGYLPPADVAAIAAELRLEDEWIGKFNREAQTLPVLDFRESAMRAGLLRRSKGMLVLTPAGRALRGDPVKLWWYLAENTPRRPAGNLERQAVILMLAAVAGRLEERPLDFAARIMPKLGWGMRDGSPIARWEVRNSAPDAWTILDRIGAVGKDDKPTRDGELFARAALRTWGG